MAVKASHDGNPGWTRPHDLRGQVQKLWDRGEILSCLITGESLFPRRLVLKAPASSELSERFEAVRAWINELRSMPYCRVEMREFRHRVLGANAVPDEIWIDTVGDATTLIGKQRDMARFMALVEITGKSDPRLLGWLAKRPLRPWNSSMTGTGCWRSSPGVCATQNPESTSGRSISPACTANL